jgi:hypothetical protein
MAKKKHYASHLAALSGRVIGMKSQGWWPMPLSLIFRLQTEYRKEVGEDWTPK